MLVAMPAPHAFSGNADRCRHCGAPLTLLQQRSGSTCGAAGCRHRDEVARMQRLAASVGRAALQAAAPLPGGAKAALLWLRVHDMPLVPLSATRQAAHRAFLQQLVDEPPEQSAEPLAEPAPAESLGEQEWRLCAQCRGRCCALGGQHHAFITLAQLLRWQQREPGRTLQDAVESYAARVAHAHLDGGCAYQGEQGCTLPREDRADICNSYACNSLISTQATLRDDPQAAFVAVTLDGDAAVHRALIGPGATQDLG